MLWDVDSRQRLGEPLISGHGEAIDRLAFSRDGSTLATGTRNGDVVLWDLDEKMWVKRACAILNRDVPQCATK